MTHKRTKTKFCGIVKWFTTNRSLIGKNLMEYLYFDGNVGNVQTNSREPINFKGRSGAKSSEMIDDG